MIHGVHTHNDAQLKRRGFRLAMVFASTALISGSVILPATAATTAVSQPTVASVVTDSGKGGDERWGGRGGTGEWPSGKDGTGGNPFGHLGDPCAPGYKGNSPTASCYLTDDRGKGGTGGTGGTGGAASNGWKPTSAVERFRG
ncbi:hypothetical protein ACFV7R_12010 [Streptomyces sp. NPDC059866]|uniref:hypothetical protein n=1 Tax=Streptomyces sp. NPDC059866 TaxID=3346978 RepID=UPI00365131FF